MLEAAVAPSRVHGELASLLDATDGHANAERIINALDSLESVQPQPARGSSVCEELSASAASERKCLQGSNLMRQAMMEGVEMGQRAALLTKATGNFMEGHAEKADRGDHADRRAYALSSGLACAAMALLLKGDRSSIEQMIDPPGMSSAPSLGWRKRSRQLLEELDAVKVSTSFWQYTNHFELLVAVNLLRCALGEKPDLKELDRALLLLTHAMVRWPSPNEFDSTKSRFAAIACVCSELCANPVGPVDPADPIDNANAGDRARLRHLEPVRQTVNEALAILERH